MIHIGKRTRH